MHAFSGAFIGVLVVAALVLGCGGSSSNGEDAETTRANLRAYAAAVVENFEETGASIEEATTDVPNDPRLSDPSVEQRRAVLLEAFQPVRDALIEASTELEGMDVPEPMSDAHNELVRVVDSAASGMDDVLTEVREVDSFDDLQSIADAIDDLFSDFEEDIIEVCPALQDVLDDEGVAYDLEC